MCKVMIVVGVKPSKAELVKKFIKKAAPFMSKNDNDGLGYIAADGESISGERWVKNSDAFKDRKMFTPDQNKLITIFQHAIGHNFVKYNKFGKGSMEGAKSILLHTRMATCVKSMENTHPFIIGDSALIHNGVIHNSEELMKKYKRVSTCDSEAILQEYLASGVNHDPANIQKLADVLDGWYAVGIVSKDKTGRQIVDVFKCGSSSLYVAYVPALETFVMCTQIGILKSTARACGLAVTAYDVVEAGVLMRFDAATGERITLVDFVPEKKVAEVTKLSRLDGLGSRLFGNRTKKAAGAENFAENSFVDPWDIEREYNRYAEDYGDDAQDDDDLAERFSRRLERY